MPLPSRQNRREEPRFTARLPIKILSRRTRDDLFTSDVSFRGLFVETADAPAVRQLVRLSIALPTTGHDLVLHAMVVCVVGPGDPEGRPQGMGLQIVALEGETRGAWWGLVRFVRDQLHELDQQSGIRVRST